MSGMIFDQRDDRNGQELHRILSIYPLPDFVKNASANEICGDKSLPAHQFADMTTRRYPCHTAPATLISSIFFAEKRAEMQPFKAQIISDRIQRAAKYFKIGGYVRRMQNAVKQANAYNEQDIPDDDFAVIFEGSNGKERHYPLRNIPEIQKAASWLVRSRDELPFELRRQIADKILDKAAAHGMRVAQRDVIERMAGLGVCSKKEAAALIRSRILTLGTPERPNALQVELQKLAELCEQPTADIQHYATLTKLAAVIDQFDRQHGLNKRYDDTLKRPDDVLFGTTPAAVAALSRDIVGNSLTGNYYKKADLARLPVHDLANTLGDDFVDAVSSAGAWVDTEKLATIVPTLPLDDARLLDDVIAAAGIQPITTKTASAGYAISQKEQMEIAKLHKPAPGSLWDRLSTNISA